MAAAAAFSVLALAGTGDAFAAITFAHLGRIVGPTASTQFRNLLAGAVAVDASTGRVYVADSGAGVIYSFSSPTDTSPQAWDGSNTPAGSFGGENGVLSVAVDDQTGDVYVADLTHLVIDKLTAGGTLIESFGDSTPTPNGQLAGTQTPAGSFSHASTPLGIAVDQATHDLYVIDSGHKVIDVFDANGHFLPAKQITATPPELYGCGGIFTDSIAVNAATGHVLVSDSCPVLVYEFEPGNALEPWKALEPWNGQPGPPNRFGGFLTLAVNNTSGDIYVANTFPFSEPAVDRFTQSREYIAPQLSRTPETNGGALAINQANGQLLLADTTPAGASVDIYGPAAVLLPTPVTEGASNVRGETATLNGTVNPEGLELASTGCRFQYVSQAAYQPHAFDPYSAGATVPCAETAAEIGAASTPVPVHADISGLTPGTSYHFRLSASNQNGTSSDGDETLTTTPTPTITNATATGLTREAVDLNATIDPHGDASASYRFEYGTSTEYANHIPVPDGSLGPEAASVTQHITGLEPDKTYHWRVVATNEAGTTTTPDHTFIYPTTTGALPDNRAYEMVTPPSKNGALIGDVSGGVPPDLSRDGERIIVASIQCFADAESCIAERHTTGSAYEFDRTAAGWQTTALSPSAQQFPVNSVWSVDAETGSALYSMPTPPSGFDDIYVRQPRGQFLDMGPTGGTDAALLTHPKAATAGFSHFVFRTNQVFSFDESADETVYEYVGTGNSQPLLVGVTGGRESHELVSVCGTGLGTSGLDLTGSTSTRDSQLEPGSLSTDGRVVFFTAVGRADGECVGTGANAARPVLANTLYARIDGESESATVKPETVLVSGHSVVDCGSVCQGSPAGDAEFQGASSDGSRVFFTSTQQLTDAASEDSQAGDTAFSSHCAETHGPNGCNLYLYDFSRPVGGRLVAVSAGDVSGGGPRVQGVVAVSDDGSHVYFVARGVLTTTANSQGQTPVSGAENLYVYDGGRVSFIGGLAHADKRAWEEGPLFANISPDGRFLVFESAAQLTADTGDGGVLQVFRYDAQTGELLRLSRGLDGFNNDGNSPASTACQDLEACADGAGLVPPKPFMNFAGAVRRDPSMSDDGSFVFFMSPVGLVAGASNDVQIGTGDAGVPIFAENVYEWHGGRVSLISDGRDVSIAPTERCGFRSAVCLVGASVSGRDVFFTTVDRLVPQDTDTQLDFYDARVCSSGDPCVPAPAGSVAACDGEACHGIPSAVPPSPGAPSASFDGAQNPPAAGAGPRRVVRCRKHFVRRHRRCVRVKHRPRHGRARGRAGGAGR